MNGPAEIHLTYLNGPDIERRTLAHAMLEKAKRLGLGQRLRYA